MNQRECYFLDNELTTRTVSGALENGVRYQSSKIIEQFVGGGRLETAFEAGWPILDLVSLLPYPTRCLFERSFLWE